MSAGILLIPLIHLMTLILFSTSGNTSEKQMFPDIFRGCRKKPVQLNGFKSHLVFSDFISDTIK